jgi:tRNA1(Val) A37 N6-methylase TrmN6
VTADLKDAGVDDIYFLGRRVRLRQSRRGLRAGTDAALVVAAARSHARGRILDLGAGTGAIGLSLAVLDPALEVALVDIDPEMAALAAQSVALNGCAGRVQALTADAEQLARSPPARRPLGAPFDLVVMNPPFTNARGSRPPPDPGRARARVAREGSLAHWVAAAAALLKPRGALVMIYRPDGLPALLAALQPSFGAIALRAVQARIDRAAMRILALARKGGRAPLTIMPPLILHEEEGTFTPLATAIHRGEATLDFAAR